MKQMCVCVCVCVCRRQVQSSIRDHFLVRRSGRKTKSEIEVSRNVKTHYIQVKYLVHMYRKKILKGWHKD